MKIEPRKAGPEDGPEIAEIFLAARRTMTYLPDLHTDDETRAFIRHLVANDEVWVGAAPLPTGSAIAGFAAIHDAGGKAWLAHLYIHPASQNHGLGRALLDRVKTQRPQGFSLWTFQENAGARRFYERHGLALARLTDGRDNEEKLPDALYVWRGEDGEGGSAVE
jgi:GNAT superfamily N-acetyltransferase